MLLRLLAIVTCLLCSGTALAYPVAPALPLDKLAEESDLICKAEVVASAPVDDAWFTKAPGFVAKRTRLKIIAVYSGAEDLKEATFDHYAVGGKEMAFNFEPQHYEFEVGRVYLIFAKQGERPGEFRQLWKNHRDLEDQGVVLAASKETWLGMPLAEVVWQELTGLLRSARAADVSYGLRHLDAMSGGDYRKLQDFERSLVLKEVAPLISHSNAELARQAIDVLGSHNPYMSDDYSPGWLATVGEGHIPGFSAWDKNQTNTGGKHYWKQLAAIVDSDADIALRVRAAQALGRSQVEEVLPLAEKWTRSSEPRLRRAGAILMADYHAEANTKLLKTLTKDADPIARRGAAEAIGYGQFTHMVEDLGPLVDDADPQVAAAAALSLLSFHLDHSTETLIAHRKHVQYHSVFINALAQGDTQRYLKDLCQVIRENQQPEQWWGGFMPWADSWQLLFRYVQQQPAEALAAGKLDDLLDALEFPSIAAKNGPHYYSSSEPRDLYALYVQRGLEKRAKTFRAQCKGALTYDIDYYFNMVDQNPANYQRP